jgi:3-carboxy-cis,cis-muconate cycloisomerase
MAMAGCASTSTCKARTKRRSSVSEPLWDALFGRTAAVEATDSRAWLKALCDVEAALAVACARLGLVESADADAVAAACAQAATVDLHEIGDRAVAGGNPVIPLVAMLREQAGSAAAAVHMGATSQDILDTAAMLVTHRALAAVIDASTEAGGAAAKLARAHRDDAMIGRTLLQPAVATTFGAVAAGWGEGLDRSLRSLRNARSGVAVQLGGAAGTMAGWYPHGPAVRAAFAAELGLTDPGVVWHTERSRIAELAAALGSACGVIEKIATDIVLLAQTGIGEVSEAEPGGSSAMAHKRNPIAAVTARAAAMQAPGLVATLVSAMAAELQRGAGPWHAEWPALTALLRTTGGAARRLADSLTGLRVDTEATARNLAAVAETNVGLDVGHAGDLVDHYLAGRAE